VICSPPEPLLEAPPEEVLATVLADAERLGLDLAGTLRTYRVVRLAEDFMSLAPGHVSLRPDQRTPMPGLTLAGDWTAQPFLAIHLRNAESLRRLRRLAQGQGESSTAPDSGTSQPRRVRRGAAKTRSRPSGPQQRAQAADPGVHAG
jgi:uncharacterized protein with NAD-binding domain and iron-sulfur cluster